MKPASVPPAGQEALAWLGDAAGWPALRLVVALAGSPPGCRGAWHRGSHPCAPPSLPFSLFLCSHLNATELGAASFWLRVALGAAVTALVGFTLYRALAKNK